MKLNELVSKFAEQQKLADEYFDNIVKFLEELDYIICSKERAIHSIHIYSNIYKLAKEFNAKVEVKDRETSFFTHELSFMSDGVQFYMICNDNELLKEQENA